MPNKPRLTFDESSMKTNAIFFPSKLTAIIVLPRFVFNKFSYSRVSLSGKS